MGKMMWLAAAATAAVALAGCNTVAGAGRDVSSAGHAVSKSAEPVH